MANQTKKPFVFKRITSMMIAAVMTATTCITAVPMAAYAEDSFVEWDSANTAVSAEWDGSIATNFAGGKGTLTEPYLVADGAQLALISNEVKNSTDFEGVYFKLTKDILLNDDINSKPNMWSPIGNSSRNFNGTFDGDGHKIIGMVVDSSGSYYGLFGYIGSKGTVKNVNTTGSSNTVRDHFGNISAVNYGTISNCTNSNDVTSSGANNYHHNSVAGVCGDNFGTLEKCKNTGSVTIQDSYYNYGGVCGYSEGTIYDCGNTGNITAINSASYIGGICGRNPAGTIEKCYNTGIVSGNKEYFGGICGYGKNSEITNCYNTASISANYCVGGICGWSDSTTVSDSYNKGDITGTDGKIAGICGAQHNKSITNCYNTGKITGASYYVAGIAGFQKNAVIESCYNTNDITGKANCNGGITGLMITGTCEINNCYNTGSVTAEGSYVGGIAGAADDIKTANITNSYNIAKVAGKKSYCGGITGYVNASTAGNIKQCFNSGNVTADSDYTAGIIAYINTATTLNACYNTGNISGASHAGGVWAESSSANSTLTECYNTGEVKGTGTNIYPVGETVGTIENVYYNSDLCTASYFSNAAYAKSTTELTAATAITDLGFSEEVWNKKTNTAYYLYYPDLAIFDNDSPRFLKAVPTPENLKAAAGNGQVTLTWNAVDEATKYAVYYYYNNEYVLVNSNITSPKYTVTGLKNGEKYGFKVKAYANNMWSATSSMVYATPAKPNIVPQNVAAKAGNGQATITWSAVSGATKYSVYKYADGAYTLLSDSIKTTSYTATGLTNGTKYGFKVKAYVGEWSASSALVYATPVGSTVPENLRIANGNGKVRVLWDKVAGATKYAVYSYLDGKYTTETTSVTATNYTVTGLTNGTKYGFKVKAYVGGKWSAASAIIYARPSASTAPGAIKAIAGNKSAEVKWSGVIGASKYAVYKYENGVYTCVNSNITDIKYTVTGLTNGTKYGFKVKAYVNGKWSAASVIAYATPTA